MPARIPYGKHELYGVEHNDESSATVPGLRVRVEAYEGGKRFYSDDTIRRGSDLYEVWFGLGARNAHIDLTYVEERPDGARCRRRVRHAITLYREPGPRFRAVAAPPHYVRATRVMLGEPVQYTLVDRFQGGTPYHVCLRHLVTRRRSCFRSRISEPRLPDSIIRAASDLGWWRATWHVGGRTVARSEFHVGLARLSVELRRYRFDVDYYDYDFDWAITVCTASSGRVRIDAVVTTEYETGEFTFRRTQPAGCRRHRFHREGTVDGDNHWYSTMTVHWRGRQRSTRNREAIVPNNE